MTWLPEQAAAGAAFERALGLCPELHADFAAFDGLFDRLRPLDPALLALCRTRVAQLLGHDGLVRAGGLSEARRAALDARRGSGQFDARERACLAFIDGFVLDPHGLTDADAAAVSAHLTPAAMVAFVEALAISDGFTRFRLILGIGA